MEHPRRTGVAGSAGDPGRAAQGGFTLIELGIVSRTDHPAIGDQRGGPVRQARFEVAGIGPDGRLDLADLEKKMKGAKLAVMDPRLSNTASMADYWLPTWPGSEAAVRLASAGHAQLLHAHQPLSPTTVRYINEQDCIACGKCEVVCPVEFNGTLVRKNEKIDTKRVTYDPELNVYAKCDLCRGRDGGPICVERCPVNVSIRAGYIQSDHLTLDVKKATDEQWKRLV